jgi:nucleolin
VREYWAWCGEVESLDLMRFPDTGRFRGIAFITFATDDGYAKALECDGTLLEGVRVKVEPCKTGKRGQGGAPGAPAPAPSPHAGPAPKTPGYNVAYVGNVAFEAGPEDVAALFGEGGGVARVRLHTDKMTGRSRGYAHVHFVSEAALDAAVSGVDGAELMGRAVRVSYAQAKKEKEVEAEA